MSEGRQYLDYYHITLHPMYTGADAGFSKESFTDKQALHNFQVVTEQDKRCPNLKFQKCRFKMVQVYHRGLLCRATGAPKLINSDLFLEKRATVPIKTQGVQRSSSGKMSTFRNEGDFFTNTLQLSLNVSLE